MLAKVAHLMQWIEERAPLHLAEEWDNPGLMWGDPEAEVRQVLVDVDGTDAVFAEAVAAGAGLVVLHHPSIWKAVRHLRTDQPLGRRVEFCLSRGIAVYAAHTNYDAANPGVSDSLAERLGLESTGLLSAAPEGSALGIGRLGRLPAPLTLGELADLVKKVLGVPTLRLVGDPGRSVQRVAVSGGDGNDLIRPAFLSGAELLVTGDISHHDALEALDLGLALIDAGHWATELPGMIDLARWLQQRLTDGRFETACRPAASGRDPFLFR